MEKIRIPLRRIGQGSEVPLYATPLSSGADLYAAITEDIVLRPSQRVLVPTGLSIALPSGFEAQVRSRSGLALKHGIITLNSPGTIDSDYRGEIKIILCNLGHEDFTISAGMRIAQLVIAPVVQAEWVEGVEFDVTEREDGGFGSTGVTLR